MCTGAHVYPHVPVKKHWHAYVLGPEANMMHSSSSQMFALRNGEIPLVPEMRNSQREP